MISIAIDGPSGAGKSTLAKSLSEKLGYLYVDTGAIYRTIGLYIYEADIDPKNEEDVVAALPEIEIRMSHGEDGLQRMSLNDCDVTEAIRLPHISLYASAVSENTIRHIAIEGHCTSSTVTCISPAICTPRSSTARTKSPH